RYLGRRHDAAQARKACESAAHAFDNWSMDLIFGARPIEAWSPTLAEALRFSPTHISAYGLTYEEGTPFAARREAAVDDDTWLALYRETEDVLARYAHYEISNHARPGSECRHNLIYWHNEEYAGFGPGAYSFLDGVRSRNATDLDAYLANPGKRTESLRLTDREIRLETVIQYLRLRDGLPKRAYVERFGNAVEPDFREALLVLA
ncbi:MAG: coproporphyrinogen III oxidase, partial [Candidatus Hydrogenedentes bacterium]|nr:coproporphyrinogen III oxidase [Candidatus Hydrogenedentota bacterium]